MGIFNEHSSNESNAGNSKGQKGERGPAGIGFKITDSGDYDIENKRLKNVATPVDSNDAINLGTVETKFLKLDGTTHMTGDLDLRGNKLLLPGEINMNRKLIKNLNTDETDNLSAVIMATFKRFSSSSSSSAGDIDLQDKFNVKNSKQQNFSHLTANYDNLVSYSDVKNIFLSRKETFPMVAALDMGNQTIYNVKDPTVADQGANKKYVDALETSTNTKFATAATQRNLKADKRYVNTTFLRVSGEILTGNIDTGGNKILNLPSPTATSEPATKNYADTTFLKLSGGTLAGDVDIGGNKITNLPSPTSTSEPATKLYVDQSHVSQSGNQKNKFLYLIEDVNESSSESNITVLGIMSFSQTPHTTNKNAYKFLMKKNSQNNYASRIGFNLYQLPAGAYTFIVEFFLPTQNKVSIDCRSTSINVNHQVFKKFGSYYKNIVQLHKWKISPPEYLTVDIKCDGTLSTPVAATGWMIVYGVGGTHNDVPSSVFDTPFVLEEQKMVMQTDLDLNNHQRLNYTPKNRFVINGVYNKSIDSLYTVFSRQQKVLVPVYCKVVKCCIQIIDNLQTYPPIFILINNSLGRGTSSKYQSYNMNVILLEGNIFHVKVYDNQQRVPSINECLVTLLLETM